MSTRPPRLGQERQFQTEEQAATNTFVLMNALLDECAKYLADLKKMEMSKIPNGNTYPMAFTLAFATNKYVFIDFLDDSDTKNVPAGGYVNAPYTKLRRLIIYNDGPAVVNAATNDSPSVGVYKGGTINANSSLDINFEYAVIESLSISLASGATQDAAVRIIGFA